MARLRWAAGLLVGAYAACSPVSLQSAIANGDTRTLNLVHAHTHETISATFLVNGQYDQGVLDKLNWFLRDWRRDEPTKMDPRLFDTVWEVYRESGSQQPIMVMSAYRSPETNAMLRRRSRAVAEHSQHILGRAMDQHYMDVPMSKVRELGMRLQRGGVGFYPTAGTPFVHLDVGGVRHWPRMNYDQLARLFPDGKTVHIPSNGQPLPGYEVARAELESRGDGAYPTASQIKTKGLFAWLFGGGSSDEDDDNAAAGVKSKREAPATRVASAPPPVSGEYTPGHYGKNEDRVASGGSIFNLFGSRPAAPPPAAPTPVVAPPAPEPVAPVAPMPQPIPANAIALAVPPSPAEGDPLTGTQPAIPDLPVVTGGSPLPPRRPAALAALEPSSPLPPPRPPALAMLARGTLSPHDGAFASPGVPPRTDAIGSLLASRSATLPAVITGGDAGRSRALGYAANPGSAPVTAAAVPMPVARPGLVSTALDRSNFRALTRPESTVSTVGRSVLGQAVPPLRAAARGDLGALAPRASTRSAFQPKASDLSADAFSGAVVRPTARGGQATRTTVD